MIFESWMSPNMTVLPKSLWSLKSCKNIDKCQCSKHLFFKEKCLKTESKQNFISLVFSSFLNAKEWFQMWKTKKYIYVTIFCVSCFSRSQVVLTFCVVGRRLLVMQKTPFCSRKHTILFTVKTKKAISYPLQNSECSKSYRNQQLLKTF